MGRTKFETVFDRDDVLILGLSDVEHHDAGCIATFIVPGEHIAIWAQNDLADLRNLAKSLGWNDLCRMKSR